MAPCLKAHAQGSTFPDLKPGVLRLYYMRFCPFAQRVKLVLDHKGIPYETVNINLKSKPEWYIARNPLGKVPALELDGKVIYESVVCAEFLDEVYPQNKLTQTDPYHKAQDRILIEQFSEFSSNFFKVLLSEGENKEAKAKLFEVINKYEQELQRRGNFLGGDKLCMVDCYVWPFFERLQTLGMVAPEFLLTDDAFPALTSYIRRMVQLPLVQKSFFDTETHLTFLKSMKEGPPKYDLALSDTQESFKH